MAINTVIRFLQAVRSLSKQGVKKEQILEFARREFGKVSELLKRQIDDIYSRYAKPAKGGKKPGDVVPIKKENLKRQLTDDEIQILDEDVGGLEYYNDFDGTVESANKIRKDRADYIADMELEYKKGKLDPGPGEKGREKFLRKKFEEMEASGDKRLMTRDEIEELNAFDQAENVTPKEGIRYRKPEEFATRKEYERYLDEVLGPPDDVFGNPLKDDLLKEWDKVKAKNVTPKEGIMATDEAAALNTLAQSKDALRKLQTAQRQSRGREADVRTAVREFLSRQLKEGKLEIPDAGERDAIKKFTQGADPIDIFRKAYGEDALTAVDDIFDQFGNKLRGDNFKEIGDAFEKYFKFNRGFYEVDKLPVPKKTYGFDEGLQSNDDFINILRKDIEEKEILEDFIPPKDRKPSAEGGRVKMAKGGLPNILGF